MKIAAHRMLRQFDKYRSRRKAPEKLVKKGFKIKKSEQDKQRAVVHVGTHTTLLCCAARPVGNPQKTAVLAPSQISRGLSKAPLCVARTYRDRLLSTYINDLKYRRPHSPAITREG